MPSLPLGADVRLRGYPTASHTVKSFRVGYHLVQRCGGPGGSVVCNHTLSSGRYNFVCFNDGGDSEQQYGKGVRQLRLLLSARFGAFDPVATQAVGSSQTSQAGRLHGGEQIGRPGSFSKADTVARWQGGGSLPHAHRSHLPAPPVTLSRTHAGTARHAHTYRTPTHYHATHHASSPSLHHRVVG